jgi:superfamily I DNA/RNA helicase
MADLKRDHGVLVDLPWHDALTGIPLEQREYYLAILRRGGPKALSQHPRHHVSTIHGVKGGEATHVVLFTDLAKKSYAEYSKNPDDEIRVFYVGVTRAKEHLHIVLPQTNMYFNEYR